MSTYFLACFGKLAVFIEKIEKKIPAYAGMLYVILFCFFFSFGSMFIKLLTRVPISQKMHFSSLFSLCLCTITDPSEKVPKDQKTYKLLLQRGILGALGLILYYQTLALLPLSITILLWLLNPLWLGILGRLFFKEMFTFVHLLLTLICFLGLILIIQPEFIFKTEELKDYDKGKLLIGVIVGIIGSILSACVFLTIRILKGKISVVVILYYYNFFSVIVGGVFSFYEPLVKLNFREMTLVFLVGFFFFLAQAARNRSLFLEKPFLVGIVSYLQLIITYFFDIFIFKIKLNILANLGCVIMVISLMSLMYYENKTKMKKIIIN